MRSLNLENSVQRTVLEVKTSGSQTTPIFSGDPVPLVPLLYIIVAISVNTVNA